MPHIQAFMKTNKLANTTELQAYFERKLLAMVATAKRRPIVWADTLAAIPAVLPQNAGRKSPLATKNLLEDTDRWRRPP